MLDLFQIGSDSCKGLLPLIKVIRKGLFPIIQIGIPLILIVLGTIDLGKAVISSDDKEVKAAQSRLFKRCLYAVAIFFVVTLVTVLMSIITTTADSEDVTGTGGATGGIGDWRACWDEAGS